jgi:hypothetical protein
VRYPERKLKMYQDLLVLFQTYNGCKLVRGHMFQGGEIPLQGNWERSIRFGSIMNTLEKLENWKNEHKARSCVIEHTDGYGSGGWTVELFGEKGQIYACDTSHWYDKYEIVLESIEDDYMVRCVSTAASDKTYKVIKRSDRWESSLEIVILAALELYDKL